MTPLDITDRLPTFVEWLELSRGYATFSGDLKPSTPVPLWNRPDGWPSRPRARNDLLRAGLRPASHRPRAGL